MPTLSTSQIPPRRTPWCAAEGTSSRVLVHNSREEVLCCWGDRRQQQQVKSNEDEEHNGSPLTPVDREGCADHSSSVVVAAATATSRPTNTNTTSPFALLDGVVLQTRFEFPFKLHQILDEAANKGMEHIVSWLPDGKAFKVHCKREFETKFIPRYFISTTSRPKYRSFQRQVAMYRFEMERKDPSSPYFGAYRHPLFVRDKLDLCARMTRRPVKKSTTSSSAITRQLQPQQEQAQKQDPLEAVMLLLQQQGCETATRSKKTRFHLGPRTPQQKNSLRAGAGNDGDVNESKNRDKFFVSPGYSAPSSSSTCSPCPATSDAMLRLNSNRTQANFAIKNNRTPALVLSSTCMVVGSTGSGETLTSRSGVAASLEAEHEDKDGLLQFAIQASQRLMMTAASSQQRTCSKRCEEKASLPTSWSRPSVLSASRTQVQSSRRNRSVTIESNDDWYLFASLFGPTDDVNETKP